MSLKRFKKSGMATDYVIKWILYISLLIVAGVAIRMMVLKYSG